MYNYQVSRLIIVHGATNDKRQNLSEDINAGIQASTETLDHQHAENHTAKGPVLLDSMTNHRGE